MRFSLKRRQVFEKIEPWLYLTPFLLFIIVFTLYPVINVFTISFKQNYSYLRGTCEGINLENYKDVLKDLIMFYSSSEKKLVTLQEYVSRMKKDQDKIFYACGETVYCGNRRGWLLLV